jgi:hypothetical protein
LDAALGHGYYSLAAGSVTYEGATERVKKLKKLFKARAGFRRSIERGDKGSILLGAQREFAPADDHQIKVYSRYIGLYRRNDV